MEVKIKVKIAYKLADRTCLVELESEIDKKQVMLDKFKVRKLREARIFTDNDMIKNEQIMKKQIRTTAEDERKRGKEVKVDGGWTSVEMESGGGKARKAKKN